MRIRFVLTLFGVLALVAQPASAEESAAPAAPAEAAPAKAGEELAIAPAADKKEAPAASEAKESREPDPSFMKELPALLKTIDESQDASAKAEAIKKIGAAKFEKVPEDVSKRLFAAALLDEDENVRKEAALAAKALNDVATKRFVFKAALMPKVKAPIRARAADALRRFDDPMVIEALIWHVTYTLRVGTATEVTPPKTIFITDGGDINNPLGLINLPIELPNIELRSVSTSVIVPATTALSSITRRNFGANPAAWQKWFEDYKKIRDARLAQEQDAESGVDDE
ncbi:MAG: hypothetical protein L6R28_15900 [Planctomycetes bacterium]|nr:hypothetical protein [Planctomycetota bacterium]